jgi:predicted DNA-binding WGR domain protein
MDRAKFYLSKIEKLPTANDELSAKYGKTGTLECTEFSAKAKYYYNELIKEKCKSKK